MRCRWTILGVVGTLEGKGALMMNKQRQPQEPLVVPKKYAGQWIAWNRTRTQIVGNGANLQEARAAAEAAGEKDPGLEWVPPANRRLIGARW